MIKKTLAAAAITMLVGGFVFGRDLFSYAKTAGSSVRDAVKREVPIEFQVDRARKMVEDLVPDIRECMHFIAEQQVDIEHLNAEIARKEDLLTEQKTTILALKNDLSHGNGTFRYASRTYTVGEVKEDLKRRFDRFKLAEESLSRDRQLLDARQRSLFANEKKLDDMIKQKQDLAVQIAELEARVKTLQAAQVVSSLEIDDSRLTRAKKLIRDLNKELDVKTRLLDAEGRFTGLIPVEQKNDVPLEQITSEIEEYFENGAADPATVELDVSITPSL